MNTKSKLQAKADSDTLTNDDIFSIIDSKMQYLDHQTNSIITTFISGQQQDTNEDFSQFFNPENVPESAASQFILKYIENYSKTLGLLLFMRKAVSNEHNLKILELLSDNTFQDYSEMEIKGILKIKDQDD